MFSLEPAAGWLERGRVSGTAIGPIAIGHPVQPAVMVGTESSEVLWSLELRPKPGLLSSISVSEMSV